MPVSNEAVAFKLRWNKREEDAVLTVVCANERGHGHPGWKAVVKVAGKRYWGAYRISVVEAVDVMVQKEAHSQDQPIRGRAHWEAVCRHASTSQRRYGQLWIRL